jgi:hypothetical protein
LKLFQEWVRRDKENDWNNFGKCHNVPQYNNNKTQYNINKLYENFMFKQMWIFSNSWDC